MILLTKEASGGDLRKPRASGDDPPATHASQMDEM